MEQILSYLVETYAPKAILVYGSYADGSDNEHSDFDALVISGCQGRSHDMSMVNGVTLDVFVYPEAFLSYQKVLCSLDDKYLENWISCLEEVAASHRRKR